MNLRIGLGLSTCPFSDARAFWRWVDLCEASDVDSIWQTDRLISSQPFLETMSLMAALAGRTERIKFGMNVVVLPFRDPLLLAKECATTDFLSAGRLLPAFGVGGDLAPEWGATAYARRGRGARADEALTVMTRLWSEERVTFQGRYYQYRGASIAPKPVQQPLPLWIGGASPAAVRRTARIGSGWLAGLQTPAQVAPIVRAISQAATAYGRRIDPDHFGAGMVYRFGDWDDPAVASAARELARIVTTPAPRDYFVVGGAADILRRIDHYRAAGIAKFILRPIADSDDDTLRQTQRLIAEVLPAVHGAAA